MKKLFAFSLLVAFALAATACETVPYEGDGDTAVVSVLAGKVENEGDEPLPAEGAPYTLQLMIYSLKEPSPTMVASCPISPDGEFSMELPDAVDPHILTEMYREYDSTEVDFSDAGVKATMLQGSALEVIDKDGMMVRTVDYISESIGSGWLIFADRDSRVSGKASFSPEGEDVVLTDTYDMNLIKGWNWMFMYEDADGNYTLRTRIPSDSCYYWGYFTE